MGTNINPGANSGFVIQGRPQEFNNMIARQGQLIRLIHAKKCSCIENGHADLFCTICKGKGYILYFQEQFDIFQENSLHGVYGDETKISPFFIPISRIKSVQRRLHSSQCSSPNGLTNYTIDSFSDTQITLVDNGNLPKRYERIEVTYSFKNEETITNENSVHDGTFKITTINTEFISTHIGDTLNVHGDLSSVSRVYNKTQDYTYTVLSFKKNIIVLDFEDGVAPIPAITDILEVDYKYIPVFYAVLLQVQTENAVQKWGEDVKIGDVRIILPGYYYIDRASIITAMTTILQTNQVITRGAATYDELPSFDVYEITGDIIDENGVVYTLNTHFELQEFNNLVWLGTTKPAQGKKYTVNYSYRPSYQVYRPQSKTINLGKDGRYPITTFGRFLNKFSVKDFDKI